MQGAQLQVFSAEKLGKLRWQPAMGGVTNDHGDRLPILPLVSMRFGQLPGQ